MNKINIILIILLSLLGIHNYIQSKNSHTNDSTNNTNLLIQESIFYIKKHAVFLASLPIIAYYHKNMINFMADSPYLSSFCFYLLLNYVCDSILNYQEQQSLLEIIALLKKTTLYLVICHGIKNYLQQKKLSNETSITEQEFLDNITENLPYSFQEITLIALKSYQELKSSLQTLNITLNIESEEFVFLCHASSVNIHSLLYLVQNDPVLYHAIYKFEKHPQTHLIPLIRHIKTEITKTFINLEKSLLSSNIQRVRVYHE